MLAVGGWALWMGACSADTAPQISQKLEPVRRTGTADLEAVDAVEAARKQLDEWAQEAAATRRRGEDLAGDDPVIDGRAEEQIEVIWSEATDGRADPELRQVFATLALAHEERLRVLVGGRKFREKAYTRADRKTTEIAFGLRHWRARR